jgi:AraC-like DNA-binding protein
MDDDGTLLDNSLMVFGPARTQVYRSLYHTPGEAERSLFHAVLRAGHLRTGPTYRIERGPMVGHEWLLCIEGAGFLRTGRRTHRVARGQLAWLALHAPHAHWPDPTHPWTLKWVRLDGGRLDRLSAILSADSQPVFDLPDPAAAANRFDAVMDLLDRRPPGVELHLEPQLSAVVADLAAGRLGASPGLLAVDTEMPGVEAAATQMRIYPHRPWRVPELAAEAGLSVSHFYRQFRAAFGATPIDFLRRERVNLAKRRLIESDDPVAAIGEQVGYPDPFYFSRQFRQVAGVSPQHYRRLERR